MSDEIDDEEILVQLLLQYIEQVATSRKRRN